MNDLDNVVKEFLLESFENLDRLDCDLVSLEKNPRDLERLASVFRTIHTIKGTCGFFNFAKLGNVTHVGESLLSRLREGQLSLTPEITSALLEMVDAVREMLAKIASTGEEGNGDYSRLTEILTRLQSSTGANAAPHKPTPAAAASPTAAPGESLSEGSIRADVGLLDKLMNLAGELVLARNQMVQLIAAQGDMALVGASQRLNLITTELQEGVMKTRMQPIGVTWDKFPRLIRDLSLACGKQARIEMEGKETELDKTIVEAIKDPLLHLLRNAVSHGIESPADRVGQGKPAEGCVRLSAYHESGLVHIVVSDDGGGIDIGRIKARALDRGLLTSEQADVMNDRELLNLIFLPGFSTASQVTDISGRGVGMDVVKTNVKRIGGALDIQNRPGQGTTIKIKIPLTLAIIPALMISCRGARYVIPRVGLLKLIRLDGDVARQAVEMAHGAPVYRLRGALLPLVSLRRELYDEPYLAPAKQSEINEVVNIVVLQADDRQFGLIVDEVNDTEDIVVKPLGKLLKSSPVFAGATILGDGTVALILDVLGVAQRSGVVSGARDSDLHVAGPTAEQSLDAREAVLLAELSDARRVVVPLSLVSRLEVFPAFAVELAGNQEVVQHDGKILPLVRLDNLFSAEMASSASGALNVVICAEEGRCVGLVVHRVLDVLSTAVEATRGADVAGILGSAIVRQKVTSVIDVRRILAEVDPLALAPCLVESS